jgi:hypothetical protein
VDANLESYRKNLEAAATMHPVRLNMQLCDHDTPPKEAVRVWIKVEKLAREMRLEPDLEVHRDTCTETHEKVYEIAERYEQTTGRKIRFCWDFSHLAVNKHLAPAHYAERLLIRPALVQIARQIHLRPFNGHHCQVPATDGKGNETPEFISYFKFVDALFACWFKGAKGGEVVYETPEFGPEDPGGGGGYGMTCLPNVWKDAIFVRDKVDKLWKKHAAKWSG